MPDFEYHVCSLIDAQRIMREGWPSHIVTALGARDRIPSLGEHHHVVEFDDSEIVDPGDEWVAPLPEQISGVLDFSKQLTKGDRLLVHCRAGESRSTALLIGILIQHGLTAEGAFRAVLDIRPPAIPNRLITEYIDDILEQNGALNEVIERYYKTLMIPGVKLPRRGRPDV